MMPAPAAADLAAHCRALTRRTLAELFALDPERYARLSFAWDDWLVDLSKERLGTDTLPLLAAHAAATGLPGWIAALFAGEKVNQSERRAALHTALRQPGDTPLVVDGHDVIPDIRAAQAQMRMFVVQVRGGRRVGASGRTIRAVVNLGIGGSDLGPLLVCSALAPPSDAHRRFGPHTSGVDVAFVANVDPEHLTRALEPLEPATTLFIVTSKSFTTQETLANATSAKAWLAASLGRGAGINAHFLAVTGNSAAAQAFGVATPDIFPLWDWVGGRYSLWSPAGLPIALKLGWDRFADLLAGAASVDVHFRTTPLERNLPVLLGLTGWWNTVHLRHPERVVIPYSQSLFRLPAYLQQLVLESNGKHVARDGAELQGPTTPSLWGECGTNSQHAFFQWLHQGTREAPVEFIVPVRATHPLANQQTLLVANALAQAQALLVGRSADTVRAELAAKGLGPAALEAAVAARVCPGNRASTTIMMPEVSAYRLGQLIALYEHRTFVEAVLYGINPFDQFGVELGKTLAGPIVAALEGGAPLADDADASTRGLVAHARALAASGKR
ncbi:MAG TPA: glucose-6-phosphate isomerase [Casimicrobiaceae bacterium]|nr:glucose-6-phosphate isomerase [Casimicrobiaceae bacterium]